MEATDVLTAGFGKVEISQRALGSPLVGYREEGRRARGVHDPLHVRAMVLRRGGETVVFCCIDLCYVGADVVAAARAHVARATGISGEQVMIVATHTHSGPHDVDAACWPEGLEAPICAAVEQAVAQLTPARAGASWGMLHGSAMNRRRFEDPVDPAVLLLRVDDRDGRPLGLICGFGCHPVVLGPDSEVISGDWAGSAARQLERRLGDGAIALVAQGACADVNPVTAGVRARLAAGRRIAANATGASYYGPFGDPDRALRIGNRTGGSVDEVEQLGEAVCAEALRLHRGIVCGEVDRLWTRTRLLAPGAAAGELAAPLPERIPATDRVRPRAHAGEPLELMLLGLNGPDVVLVGAPAELFAETGVRIRRELRAAGVGHPFAVGYANGWRGYLPPARAFAEGGYEVDWASAAGLSNGLEDALVDQAVAAVGTVR